MDSEYKNDNSEEEEYRINRVQTFGYLIGVDPIDFRIRFYSENVNNLFYLGERNLLGLSIYDIYNFKLNIPKIIALDEGEYYISNIDIDQIKYHLRIHYFNNKIYIEIEKYIAIDSESEYMNYYSHILKAKNTNENWKALINSIQHLTGFERVLVYELNRDYKGGGVILYDTNEDEAESLIGVRFSQFKTHYKDFEVHVKNKSRLLTDLFGKKIKVISDHDDTVDLTYTEIRSQSDTYLNYLKSAGASTDYSISIFFNNKLWGLVLVSDKEVRHIPFLIRQQCELLTKLASLVDQTYKSQTNVLNQTNFKNVAVKLKESILIDINLKRTIENNYQEILALTSADGLALISKEDNYIKGNTPDIEEIVRIKNWAGQNNINNLFYKDSFTLDYGVELSLSHFSSGVMFSFLGKDKDNFIIWFRKENIQKIYFRNDSTDSISSRSFNKKIEISARFQEYLGYEKGDTSKEWTPDDIAYAKEIIMMIDNTIEIKSHKINSLYQELKNINEELESFSYTVSHDLRTPLTVMKLNCQMLQRSLINDANVSNRLASIVLEIDRMTRMMQEILSLSKTNQLDIQLKSIHPETIIEKVISDLIIYLSVYCGFRKVRIKVVPSFRMLS